MTVRFARMPGNEDLPVPARQTEGSAGFDIASADADFVLQPTERRLVHAGFRMELPPGVECQVRPRSGLAMRHGLMIPNSPATIDPDFRGELRILLWNAGAEPVAVPRGMRIAQLVFARFEVPEVREVEGRLTSTQRGDAGFGSTGA